MRLYAALLVSSLLAAARPPAPPPGGEGAGEVEVLLIVEDARARPVTDLKVGEIVIQHDGVNQAIRSLRYLADHGWYELRYVPTSGQAGAVALGVNRRGTRLRGPDGPQVTPRWIAATRCTTRSWPRSRCARCPSSRPARAGAPTSRSSCG